MNFFVYENWRARGHKGVIHVGSCGSCKNGSGIAGGTASSNGKWHSPVPTLVAAQKLVKHLGAYEVIHRCAR